jgi:cellobiose phosphorylase
MTAGNDAPTTGEGKNSWLTGTAAWSFVGLSNYILGIRADYDGLVIDPCIPKDWDKYNVVRKFRGVTYNIEIANQAKASKGNVKILVDGKTIEGNKIPIHNDKSTHVVTVVME